MDDTHKCLQPSFAERVLNRACNTNTAIAVFYDQTGPTAMRADTARAREKMVLAPDQLVGIYDEDCPLDWLVADLADAEAQTIENDSYVSRPSGAA